MHKLDFQWESERADTTEIFDISTQDVAVIGMACRFPSAKDMKEYWKNLCLGKDCIKPMPLERQRELRFLRQSYFGDEPPEFLECGYLDKISQFDYPFFSFTYNEACNLDINQRLFLQTVYHCLEDAGYAHSLKGGNVGVYLGFSNDFETERTYKQLIREWENEINASAMVGNMRAMISARISHYFDFCGPNLTVDTTCSSSLVALHTACQALRNRDCDYALAGGIETHLLPIVSKDYKPLGIESSDQRTKSFDNQSDGTGNGEGVGAVLLKPLYKAVKDNDHIYCVIKGGAVNQNGNSLSITVPNVKSQEALMIQAWLDAGISPDTLSLFEAHGSGTPLGDVIEMVGIQEAFRHTTEQKQFCALGCVKTNIGHLGGASGIAAFIKTALCLKNKKLVPMIHFKEPNREILFSELPVYVHNEYSEWPDSDYPRRVGISSYGLSGTNCHIVLEEYDDPNVTAEIPDSINLFTASAQTATVLERLISSYVCFLSDNPEISLRDLCYTALKGRTHFQSRLAVAVSNIEELQDALNSWLFRGENNETHQVYDTASIELPAVDEGPIEYPADWDIYTDAAASREAWNRIARMYAAHEDILWDKLLIHPYKKITLPLYPYQELPCWPFRKKPDKTLFNRVAFTKVPSITECQPSNRSVLVVGLSSENGIISEEIRKYTDKIESYTFETWKNEIDDQTDSARVLIGRGITDMVLWLPTEKAFPAESDDIRKYIDAVLLPLHEFVKNSRSEQSDQHLRVFLIGGETYRITGWETLNPVYSLVYGYASSVNYENNLIRCRSIDTDRGTDAGTLVREIFSQSGDSIVAYRDNQRYLRFLMPGEDIKENRSREIRHAGAYIIAGGTGGIGLEIADYLADHHYENIILIKRRAFPDRDPGSEFFEDEDKETPIKKKRMRLEDIRRKCVNLDVVYVDITQEEAVFDAFQQIRKKYSYIRGVIQLAGKAGNGLIITKSAEHFNEVLNAKLYGTIALDKATQTDDLDFFVIFSSVASLLPVIGQSDYITANMFLDAYAEYRNARNQKTICINWAMWKETGMAVDHQIQDSAGFQMLTTAEAVDAFDSLLYSDAESMVVGRLIPSDLNHQNAMRSICISDQLIGQLENKSVDEPSQPKTSSFKDRAFDFSIKEGEDGLTENERILTSIWAEALKIEEISLYDNFYDLGGNSLLALHLLNQLNRVFPHMFQVADIYSYPTVFSMAQYLDKKRSGEEAEAVGRSDMEDILIKLEKGELSEEEAVTYLDGR